MSKAKTLAGTVSTGGALANPSAIPVANITGLATVATSGAYADLSGKPSLATVATSGSYNDLTNKPTDIGTADNLSGGSNGTIPYQSASGTTQMLAAGTSGQVLTSNGAAAPTWATPAPGAGTVTAVASGSLSDGTMVVVNSDGTVSAVTANIDPTPSVGSEYPFSTAGATYEASAYDSVNNKVVVAWRDSSTTYGYVAVGSVSGTTITFGAPVVFNSANTYYCAVAFDIASGKIVIAYRNSGGANVGTAIVGTVSGTSITFGTAVVFKNNSCAHIAATYHTAAQKIVINYTDTDNVNIEGIVGTVSGTSISFGSPVAFGYGVYGANMRNVYDSTNQKIVATWQNSNNGYAQAVVSTVSGTSISFGSVATVSSSFCSGNGIAYDSVNQKIVITYVDESTSSYGKAVVGTVSGTSISFGSAATFNYATTTYTDCVYDVAAGKIAIAFYNNGLSRGQALAGTVSGTSISFSSVVSFNPTSPSLYVCIVYDSANQRNVISYQDSYNSSYGTSCVFLTQTTTTNLTSENYIGVSNAAYTNGQTVTIQTVGSTDDAQSGLTPGQAYYIQKNGSLGLSPDTPAVFAGTALAATKLIIKG